jgi:hypothetical protein
MAHNVEDIDLILSRLGYTVAQIDLAKYNATKIAKQIKTNNFQQAKILLSIMNKPELAALNLLLSLENLNLAQIIVYNVNSVLAQNRQNKADNPGTIELPITEPTIIEE